MFLMFSPATTFVLIPAVIITATCLWRFYFGKTIKKIKITQVNVASFSTGKSVSNAVVERSVMLKSQENDRAKPISNVVFSNVDIRTCYHIPKDPSFLTSPLETEIPSFDNSKANDDGVLIGDSNTYATSPKDLVEQDFISGKLLHE